MELVQIIGIAFIATLIVTLLKQTNAPSSAMAISLVVGISIFLALLDDIAYVFQVLEELALRANINQFYLATLLRIVGIAYLAEFGAQICRDAGEGALAGRIEFAAKVIIMVLAVPIIGAIIETIIRLLP